METEAAFSSSANSFILEKVLQEVKEVENRERQEEEEASNDDLKFRPGFVHLLKDRFALLSIKSANTSSDDDGPIKGSTSVFDISGSNNLGNTRQISRSSDQLDGRSPVTHRNSTPNIGSPERHVNRINGSVSPSATKSSRAYVRLNSNDSSVSPSGLPSKGQPNSIHLFSRSTDSKTLNQIRHSGNKVIIIESAAGKKESDVKKSPGSPSKTSNDFVDPSSTTDEKSGESWPVPNIVSSTRSIFEQNRSKRPAPAIPSATTDDSGTKSPKSPSSPARDAPTPPVTPTQILVHGQPIRVLQTNQPKSVSSENVKIPSPAPRRSQKEDRNSSTSVPKSVFLPTTQRSSDTKTKSSGIENDSERNEAVVTVSEAKLMFDKGMSTNKTSPKKSKGFVFTASNNADRKPPVKKFAAPTPPLPSKSNSAGPSSPSRQPLYKAASLPSVVPKPVNTPKTSIETSSRQAATPSPSQSASSRNDSSTWQTWDDIPKPKRKSFITDARRVDISKEQLSASRAKNKSFFFTVTEPANKSQKLETEDPHDRTVKINIPKVENADSINMDSSSAPSQSRLAQETFWSSYRDEDANASNVDPELFGDYQKLMASVKSGGSTDSASIERELEELPSTNIDDIMNDIGNARTTAAINPRTVGIRVIVKDKKKVKHKLSFAKGADLISTYEYLSERAMIEELGISPDFDLDGAGELSIDDPVALFGLDDVNYNEEETMKVSKPLSGKSAVSSGSLASYKSKYQNNDYTWGHESEKTSSSSASRDLLDGDGSTNVNSHADEEISKPTEMNWSSATTSDLLF